jgi:hypothetical protein
MPNNLRICYAHLGRTVPLLASSEAADAPASNLETGNRQLFWHATSASEQTLTWDAGATGTLTVQAGILPRADLLVGVGASVALQWSSDGTSWTDAATPLVPITLGALKAPTNTDYYLEFAALTKRAWRWRIYGTLTGVPTLAGGVFVGPVLEVARNPIYGRTLSISRPHKGLEVELSWGHWAVETDATALLTALASVSEHAAEQPHETVAGVVYGGYPHYLYDPVGGVFRTAGVAYLLPVLLLTPEAASTTSPAFGIEQGPSGVRWRERR